MALEGGPFTDGQVAVQPIPKLRDTGVGVIEGSFFQTNAGTFAYCELVGEHGIRENIPAPRHFFIASGTAVFNIDGVDHEAETGSIVVVPLGASFNFTASGSTPVRFFVDFGFQMDLDTIPSPK